MMTPDMMAKLRRSLIEHEGYRKFPYKDTVNKITIGIGYNLSERGLDEDWINAEFQKDIQYFYTQFLNFPWFEKLNTDRQIVLIDMSFMGWKRFLEFTGLLNALARFDFKKASEEMLNSEWATQTKSRATVLAQVMLTGEYNI